MPATPDDTSHILLNAALLVKDINRVTALIEAGAIQNVCRSQELPMVVAARAAFLPGMEALHRAGADINSLGYDRFTPLMLAACQGDLDTGKWLLSHGADLRVRNANDETAFSLALRFKKLDFMEMALQECGNRLEDNLVRSARLVIGMCDARVAQWLVEKGVSPDLADEKGSSWLRLAQTNRQHAASLTQVLVDAGANLNRLDGTGRTPLHQAFYSGLMPQFLFLLQAGADPDQPDRDGSSMRRLIERLPPTNQAHSVFTAWEASCKAQRIIDQVAVPPAVRPL